MELSAIIETLIGLIFATGVVMHYMLFFILVKKLKKERAEFWNSLGPKNELGLPDPAVIRKVFFKRKGLPDDIYQEYKFLINGGVIAGFAGMGACIIYLVDALSPSLYSSMVDMRLPEFIDFCIKLFFGLGFPYAIFSSIIFMRALKKKHPEFWNKLGPENELGLIAGSVQYRVFIRGDGLPVEIYTEFRGLIDSIRVSFYAGTGAFSIILIESLAPSLYSSMVSLWYRIGF